jgi:aspartate-semialdehyde dehydrogenase
MSTAPVLAIVGVTGAVGQELLSLLEEREFPVSELRVLASSRSAGKSVEFRGREIMVRETGEHVFAGVDIAVFSAGSGTSRQFGPGAAAKGVTVIDNSSAFRMDEGVPLVVPEVNAGALPRPSGARGGGAGIIANPNCSTIILLVAVTPLRAAFGVERLVVSTYQAASGAGARGMDELVEQTRDALESDGFEELGEEASGPRASVFHEPYAFNLFSHNSELDVQTGLNAEEQKMISESRKIWGDPGVRISATCVRVPTLRAHAESVNVTLSRPATLDEVRRALAGAPGVEVVDDRAENLFPTPLKAQGRDPVLVGRVREDPSQLPEGWKPGDPTRGFDLFICGDQLRKGAALNAVQIAELLLA